MAAPKSVSDSRQVAKTKWAAAFGRFFLNMNNLRSFAGTTTHALQGASNFILEKYKEDTKKAFADPFYKDALKNNPFWESENLRNEFADAMAQRSIRLTQDTA